MYWKPLCLSGLTRDLQVNWRELRFRCALVTPCRSTAMVMVFVDLEDASHFDQCLQGPGNEFVSNCACLDADQDGDIDLADFWRMQLELLPLKCCVLNNTFS
jgi:hypothetical protein